MNGNPQLLGLLEEMVDSGKTPEDMCRDCPELLPEVRRRWQEFCLIDAEIVALLPELRTPSAADPITAGPPAARLPQVPGYTVEAVLGHGGMGVVYKARQLALDRPVAVKMLLAGPHAGPQELARFRRETAALASLRHPNIVQVYDAGDVEGRRYFTMELVEGGSLARKLSGTPQPAHLAAALLFALAGAVEVAHRGGIVHRDLKPSNILLLADGTPKVSDFGLARRLGGETGLTPAGAALGTPSYMAPEQAQGRVDAVGPSIDVYALGAILYEMLTGRPPFRAETDLETLQQLASREPVPPSRLNSSIPRDLETICLKCLRKEPRRRYASADELANDLRRYLAGQPIRARPVGAVERSWKWVKRRPTLAALLGVTLLTLVSLTVLSGNLVAARNDADEKRKTAEQEADKAKKARDFLASIFDLSAREKQGTFSPFQLLDRAEQRIPLEFADHPELRADLLATLEEARSGLGAPAGMLLEVDGGVELRPRKGAAKQAARNVLLFVGDRLCLAAEAQVRLVVLSDLHQEWLAPGREATVARQGCVPAAAVGRRSQDVMMTFVSLPKGTFYMGYTRANPLNGIPGSAKKTDIKEDFEIAVHDVTQGQWEVVMGNNPSQFSRRGTNQANVSCISEDELKLFPVETVSWDDAQEFVTKLNEKERGGGYRYRLPTEAEWEYACRGGATSEDECSFHFYIDKPSNDLSSDQANFNGNYPAGNAPGGKYLGRPTRVGSCPPNKLGLCDMHGNVWQWTSSSEGSGRGIRGGSWQDWGSSCQAAFRLTYPRTERQNSVGFRLARVPLR